MKLTLKEPVEGLKGRLGDYTIYTNKNGVVIMRKINRKPPTEKQIEQRKWFIGKYAGMNPCTLTKELPK